MSEFKLTQGDIDEFATKGFVKLEGFLSREATDMLDEELDGKLEDNRDADWYGNLFNRIQYDFANDKPELLELLQQPVISRALTKVTGRSLLFTQSVGFELRRDQDIGLSWHVGTVSFAFQHMEDFGCSLWIPTARVDPGGQGGGISLISKQVFSGLCMFQYNEMLSSYVQRLEERGEALTPETFSKLELHLVSNPEVTAILDEHAESPSFEVGDAVLFDKYVLHRSCPLTAGPIETRGAFTLRFVDVESTYDRRRARNLVPFQKSLNYDQQTSYCLKICERDGEPLLESPLFAETRERRVLHA